MRNACLSDRLNHDSRFTFTSPHTSAGGRLVHDSRFTFTSPQVWKAEYGKRKTKVALTIHDSHSRSPKVGRWKMEVGRRPGLMLGVHDSRFTFTPPASVGRWSASQLSPILPLEELFHVGVHLCPFAASEGFVNLESASWGAGAAGCQESWTLWTGGPGGRAGEQRRPHPACGHLLPQEKDRC